MKVSVIATIYNERHSIERLLASLAAQTRRPDEIVICDGGSTDGAVAALRAYAAQHPDRLPNLRVLEAPGANISRGRNLAIEAAAGPIIAATDAGVRLEATWLEKLVEPWTQDEHTLAAAGWFVPDAQGVFPTAMAATVLPLRDDIDPDRFLPSSRSVAFTKTAWAQAGGYPEWLDYCEDLLFDFAINAQAPARPTGFTWAPDARVHFRPRTSLCQFWTQYYRYARGDGKADLWRKRHAIRYATYLVALPLLLGHACFGFFARWLGWLGLLAGVILYCRRPWQRLRVLGASLPPQQRLVAALLVPLIRVTGDLAKMAGYPVGLRWRWRHRAAIPNWRNDLEALH
ncbi:glycosyltransferase [Caldilinea sp.]|uniref:glycosyltransferase n=1 Tax=Caldilinea sp. TaxID=2293560 RepID=UPI002CAE727C|nr:glycosyltransferase [Anaerolineales bacterium]HQY91105.1 glycosyltransferase [Caldilinea sp.]HRA67302.1 glycosyltransferase [Caldilinea sp.]